LLSMTHMLSPLQIGKHIVRFPIIQGGMAVRVSGANLAAAVANAGGVGTISSFGLGLNSSYFERQRRPRNFFAANRLALIDELKEARTISPKGIIGVNIFVATKDYAEIAQTAAAHGADAIVTAAGLPLNLPEYTADYPDVALVPIVPSVEAAQAICEAWQQYDRLPDAFIVENCKLVGGHFGSQCEPGNRQEFSIAATISHLREYLTRQVGVRIPLIVAGGVWARKDIARMLAIGADGVQIGSRFIATTECDADPRYKEFHLNASPEDVIVVPSPVGKPGRALHNSFAEQAIAASPNLEQRCIANCLTACLCRDARTTYCILQALATAARGDVENGLVFSGANVGRAERMMSVAQLMVELTAPEKASDRLVVN
jgi:nitronate monooxygenase